MRLALLVAVAVLLLWCIYYVRQRTPPGCADHRTVRAVQELLQQNLHLISPPQLSGIRTAAGGWAALRYQCEAELVGPAGQSLPPEASSGVVQFTSELRPGSTVQRVTVSIEPLLTWQKAD